MRDVRRRPHNIQLDRVGLGSDFSGIDNNQRVSDRLTRRTKRDNRKRLVQIGLGIIVVLFSWQLLSPVRSISVKALDPETATTKLHELLDQGTRRNVLIRTDKLASDLTGAIPDAVNTTITHNIFLSRLSVTVQSQMPALRWQSRGVQYVLSDYGVALAKAGESDANFPLIFDEANLEVVEKQQIVPRDFVIFIHTLDEVAGSQQRTIKERYISGSTREVRLVFADKPYSVRLSTLRTVQEQLAELNRLEAYFTSSGRGAQQYVDLRIAGRAYWQ